MGDIMKCAALTGISSSIINELKKGKPRTLELQSAHNIISLMGVNPGDCIFITSVDLDDLTTGDSGIIVNVESIIISMKRIMEYVHPFLYEERERMSARIKLKYQDTTIAKNVEGLEWSRPTYVDIIMSSCYNAG